MFGLNFGGNPAVMELLQTADTCIDKLLDIDSFPGQFRTCNPKLEKYMDMGKYNTLVQYITQVGDPNNRNRAYKYPIAASEILSIDNSQTMDAILRQGKIIIQKQQIQEKWVQKQVDQCDSQYCSSDGSTKNIQEYFQSNVKQRQNIPPQDQKQRNSLGSKKKVTQTDNQSQGRKSLGSMSQSSITSDDFPLAEQQRKKIRVKQIIKKSNEIQIKPLLTQLCQYYQKQFNYTLTGYVTKVLELILKKNPRRLLRQIFMSKVHKSLVKHVESQLVCDFVINMILNTQNQAENARQYFLSLLLKSVISYYNEQHKMIFNKSIIYILVEIVSKLDPHSSKRHQVLMNFLYQDASFQKIAVLIFDEKTTPKNKQCFGYLIQQYLKKLLTPIIINPPNTAQSAMRTSQEERIKQLRQKLQAKFQICFKQFIDKAWQNITELAFRDHPSYVYIKQLEIINMLIKNNLFWSRMELSNQDDIFAPLIQLCRKFANNSFLHNQAFELLKQMVHISAQFPILFKKAFNCKTFLLFCLETVSQGGQYSNIMFKGQCIYLCQAIRHNSSEAAVQFKNVNKAKWSKIQQCILKNIEKINATLGGFSVKRPHKTQIQFTKQQIFQKFGCFLRGQIPLKKSKSLQQQELEDIASQGSAEWNDWNQFSNYNADEVDQREK